MNHAFDQDFCPACGTILPLPDGSTVIQCLLCKKIQDIAGLCGCISGGYNTIYSLVFHGTQSTAHVTFQNTREEKKALEGDEAIEGTLVRSFSSFNQQDSNRGLDSTEMPTL